MCSMQVCVKIIFLISLRNHMQTEVDQYMVAHALNFKIYQVMAAKTLIRKHDNQIKELKSLLK